MKKGSVRKEIPVASLTGKNNCEGCLISGKLDSVFPSRTENVLRLLKIANTLTDKESCGNWSMTMFHPKDIEVLKTLDSPEQMTGTPETDPGNSTTISILGMTGEIGDLIIVTQGTRIPTEAITLIGIIVTTDTEITEIGTVIAEIGIDTEKEIATAEETEKGKEETTTTEGTKSDRVRWLLLPTRATWQVTVVMVLT